MCDKCTIGIVCFARTTFDYQNAHEIYKKSVDRLKNTYSDIEWVVIEELVIEAEEARKVAEIFSQKMVDAVVLVSGTFHLGYLALEVHKKIKKPLLLWGFNELPYDGGRIRLNSAVGVHLDASNLYKAGVDVNIHLGDYIDRDWVKTIQVQSYIKNCKLAIVGGHAHSFYNFSVQDLALFKNFSSMVSFFDLQVLYTQNVTDVQIEEYKKKLLNIFEQGNITDIQLEQTAKLTASIKKFMDKHKLNGITVRGWPEFAQEYGIAPYASMSLLQSEGYVIANEGDIEGLLSMMIGKKISNTNPILMDVSQIYDDDTALLWHMGEAPCNLRSNDCKVSLDNYFAAGKGVTADFVLQEGEITLFRVDFARGRVRIYINTGRVEKTEQQLKGTYARVSVHGGAKNLFKKVVTKGFGHHLICVYGDISATLMTFSNMYGFDIVS